MGREACRARLARHRPVPAVGGRDGFARTVRFGYASPREEPA
jgi:hypothetical protein